MNRSTMLMTLLCCALAAPLAAQQAQVLPADPAVTATATPAPDAAPVAVTAEPATAGPRIAEAPKRVEATFTAPRSSGLNRQDDTNINRSPLIYILVAAVLVVLLVFLIKRA